MSVHGKPKQENLSTVVQSRMKELRVDFDPSFRTLCIDSLIEIGTKLKALIKGNTKAVADLMDPYISQVDSICRNTRDHHKAILALNEYFDETAEELENEALRADATRNQKTEKVQDIRLDERDSMHRQQNTMSARVGRSKKPRARVIHRW